jgi:hypothetical protein
MRGLVGCVEGDYVVSIKKFVGVLLRVGVSVIFAGIFYIGWMAIAIPTIKTGFGGFFFRGVIWILAPIITGLGFAVGQKIFELLPYTEKSGFWETYKWCLAGCAIGGGILWLFGPMLIVFGMFAAGTMSVVLHEAARIRKKVECV